jgi:hypothetical protein
MSATLTHDGVAAVEVHDGNHHNDHGHGKPGIMHYLWNTDHKMIALQFLWSATFFLLFGGAMALRCAGSWLFPDTPFRSSGTFCPIAS